MRSEEVTRYFTMKIIIINSKIIKDDNPDSACTHEPYYCPVLNELDFPDRAREHAHFNMTVVIEP